MTKVTMIFITEVVSRYSAMVYVKMISYIYISISILIERRRYIWNHFLPK